MAKGKHSTALFEVIHSGRKPEGIAQSLRTPKWWFKSRHSSAPTAPAPEPVFHQPEPAAPAAEPSQHTADFARGRSSAVYFGFDRSRQEVQFRLRYTTALVGGFAMCVVIGLAYVVGRHLGHGPQTASAAEQQPSIQQLMQQPPNPNVTAVKKTRPSQAQVNDHGSTNSNGMATPRQTASSVLIPANAYVTMPRKPHLNYAIIGIFPIDQPAKAEEARNYFTSHGIPCTLEKTGWTLERWISLVGTAGFPSSSSADWKTYTSNIVKVAEGTKSSFEKLTPGAYGWRGEPTDQPYGSGAGSSR